MTKQRRISEKAATAASKVLRDGCALTLFAFGMIFMSLCGCKPSGKSVSREVWSVKSGSDQPGQPEISKSGKIKPGQVLSIDSLRIGGNAFMTIGASDTVEIYIKNSDIPYQKNDSYALDLVIKPYRVSRTDSKEQLDAEPGILIRGLAPSTETGEIIIPIERIPGFGQGTLKFPIQVSQGLKGKEYQLSVNIRSRHGSTGSSSQGDNIWPNKDKGFQFPMLTTQEAAEQMSLRNAGMTDSDRFSILQADVNRCNLLSPGVEHELRVIVHNKAIAYHDQNDTRPLLLSVHPLKDDQTTVLGCKIGGITSSKSNPILLPIANLHIDTTVLRFPILIDPSVSRGPIHLDVSLVRSKRPNSSELVGITVSNETEPPSVTSQRFDFTILTGDQDLDKKHYDKQFKLCGFNIPVCDMEWAGGIPDGKGGIGKGILLKETQTKEGWQYAWTFVQDGVDCDKCSIILSMPNGKELARQRMGTHFDGQVIFKTKNRLASNGELIHAKSHISGFPTYRSSLRYSTQTQ